jgi:hypothetical protein
MPVTNFTVSSGINIGTSTISESTGDFTTYGNITVGNIVINGITNDITTSTIHTSNVVTGNITTSNLVVGSQSVTTLANVASTGSYNDLINKPAEFSRVATTSVTGLVQVGGNLSISSGVLSLSSSNVTSALGFTPVNSSIVGQANGLATLDSNGKLPLTQLDSTVVGSLNYQGTWNANTNSPAIIPSTGTKGHYYTVSVAGTTTIDGNNNWTVGDIIAFNGTVWNQIQGAASDVVSVAGKTGVVSLTASDVGLGNVTNTAQLASTQTLTLTGDVTASATALSTGTISTTLANTSVTAGTYNNVATAITPFTVDTKGRITNTGTAINVTPAWSSITSKPTTLNGFGITDGQATLVSGTNIKTVNNNSLLGSGDITISTSGASITNVVTATGMTTLTSTPTLLKITPTGYGVAGNVIVNSPVVESIRTNSFTLALYALVLTGVTFKPEIILPPVVVPLCRRN